jgi:hypothetical protein
MARLFDTLHYKMITGNEEQIGRGRNSRSCPIVDWVTLPQLPYHKKATPVFWEAEVTVLLEEPDDDLRRHS